MTWTHIRITVHSQYWDSIFIFPQWQWCEVFTWERCVAGVQTTGAAWCRFWGPLARRWHRHAAGGPSCNIIWPLCLWIGNMLLTIYITRSAYFGTSHNLERLFDPVIPKVGYIFNPRACHVTVGWNYKNCHLCTTPVCNLYQKWRLKKSFIPGMH